MLGLFLSPCLSMSYTWNLLHSHHDPSKTSPSFGVSVSETWFPVSASLFTTFMPLSRSWLDLSRPFILPLPPTPGSEGDRRGELEWCRQKGLLCRGMEGVRTVGGCGSRRSFRNRCGEFNAWMAAFPLCSLPKAPSILRVDTVYWEHCRCASTHAIAHASAQPGRPFLCSLTILQSEMLIYLLAPARPSSSRVRPFG